MTGLATLSIYRATTHRATTHRATTHRATTHRATTALLVVLLLLGGISGCGSKNALSQYEEGVKKQEAAAERLGGLGAKTTLKAYPPHGDAWLVVLRGATVDATVLEDIKKLGRISELDFSKSTIDDALVARLDELELGNFLLRLDLSQTSVTDAGFEKIGRLPLLRDLNLTGTKVTAGAVTRFLQNRKNDAKILRSLSPPR